jgi:hypothetical protein
MLSLAITVFYSDYEVIRFSSRRWNIYVLHKRFLKGYNSIFSDDFLKPWQSSEPSQGLGLKDLKC